MQVQDLMTRNPITCSTDAKLQELARLMLEYDCGAIPLYEPGDSKRIVGVVTDRDIVCRGVASGNAMAGLSARQIMTSPAMSLRPNDPIETAVDLMARKQVRRLPVVDSNGVCIGMLSEGDVAQRASPALGADLERSITRSPQLVRNH
jgi:CBS domain-containing protein